MKIKNLIFLGFSLEVIRGFTDTENKGNHDQIKAYFQKRLEETRAKIGKLERIEDILQGACNIMKK